MYSAYSTRMAARRASVAVVLFAALAFAPAVVLAQTSPFMTGATALQTNILAWLTPVAVILVMALGGMAMANRVAQVSSTYGHGDAHTIVENCGNTVILRCSASEGGGTARFASQLIGEREVLRTSISKSRRASDLWSSVTRSEQFSVESAVLPSQIEQLPDLAGYLKFASDPTWLSVRLEARQAWERRHSNTADLSSDRSRSGAAEERRSDSALGNLP